MKTPEADLGGGLTPESVGTLNLRQEVLDGFRCAVRQKHRELQAIACSGRVMRQESLCPEMPRNRHGAAGHQVLLSQKRPEGLSQQLLPGLREEGDVTALSKPSVANYIQIAENWEWRLMDYLADLPEGGLAGNQPARCPGGHPCKMNRPLKPKKPLQMTPSTLMQRPLSGDDQQALPAGKRTHFAEASLRRSVARPKEPWRRNSPLSRTG